MEGPLHWKDAAGSFHGPNWSIFFLDLETTDKLEFTAWFEVNPTFGSRGISIWKFVGQICPPPPVGLGLKHFSYWEINPISKLLKIFFHAIYASLKIWFPQNKQCYLYLLHVFGFWLIKGSVYSQVQYLWIKTTTQLQYLWIKATPQVQYLWIKTTTQVQYLWTKTTPQVQYLWIKTTPQVHLSTNWPFLAPKMLYRPFDEPVCLLTPN